MVQTRMPTPPIARYDVLEQHVRTTRCRGKIATHVSWVAPDEVLGTGSWPPGPPRSSPLPRTDAERRKARGVMKCVRVLATEDARVAVTNLVSAMM